MTLIDFPSKPELLKRLDEVASGWPIHASPDLGKPYGDINGCPEIVVEANAVANPPEEEVNDLARYREDKATSPAHYKHLGVECIEITENMNFCLGNVVKYAYRCNLKGGVEDLKKARWYLDREIARREKA
jgi:hypothetical protein